MSWLPKRLLVGSQRNHCQHFVALIRLMSWFFVVAIFEKVDRHENRSVKWFFHVFTQLQDRKHSCLPNSSLTMKNKQNKNYCCIMMTMHVRERRCGDEI